MCIDDIILSINIWSLHSSNKNNILQVKLPNEWDVFVSQERETRIFMPSYQQTDLELIRSFKAVRPCQQFFNFLGYHVHAILVFCTATNL